MYSSESFLLSCSGKNFKMPWKTQGNSVSQKRGHLLPLLILSQNCGCAKFHTEYVRNTEYNLTSTTNIYFLENESF